ncbi:uncharacterized protein [Arachis hypogaea]|uniref:uncharacterized protein n=1 Tax=Arachis hypogaea TaxID=3818 RepID=UPI000DED38DA|nr:uncharacterized protein LOC112770138 [Arachis hypogaea]
MENQNRSWMYDRTYDQRRGLKPSFIKGVNEFVDACTRIDEFLRGGLVRCPCSRCQCGTFKQLIDIKIDLYTHGFKPNYWVWTEHGEEIPTENQIRIEEDIESSSELGDVTWEENFDRYHEMVVDALQPEFHMYMQPTVEEPNRDAKRFYDLLDSVSKPLWENCIHSRLSLASRMLSIKSEGNQSQGSFDQWATLFREMQTTPNEIPANYYEAKKIVSQLGFKEVKIDCCVNGCMIYYKEDKDLRQCKFCREQRFKPRKGKNKEVPYKRMHYLPLIPRLQRLYASMSTAPHMLWHHQNRRNDDVMTHPSHGEAWKHFDTKHPHFASEPRNVRLGLCSDGFSPNVHFSTLYSCWPVIVTPYNLPPHMCIKTLFCS